MCIRDRSIIIYWYTEREWNSRWNLFNRGRYSILKAFNANTFILSFRLSRKIWQLVVRQLRNLIPVVETSKWWNVKFSWNVFQDSGTIERVKTADLLCVSLILCNSFEKGWFYLAFFMPSNWKRCFSKLSAITCTSPFSDYSCWVTALYRHYYSWSTLTNRVFMGFFPLFFSRSDDVRFVGNFKDLMSRSYNRIPEQTETVLSEKNCP